MPAISTRMHLKTSTKPPAHYQCPLRSQDTHHPYPHPHASSTTNQPAELPLVSLRFIRRLRYSTTMTHLWMLSVCISTTRTVDSADSAIDQALLDGPREPRPRSNRISDYRRARAVPDAQFFSQDPEDQQSKQLSYRELPDSFRISPSDTV